MAIFSTISWSPDDEITSSKLQQMADNSQWAHDNIMQTLMLWESGGGIESALVTNLRGRTPGTAQATKALMAFCTFDTTVPVLEHEFQVDFPFGFFSVAPICVATCSTGTLPIYPYISNDNYADHVIIKIRYIDGRTAMMDGVCNVWAVGYQGFNQKCGILTT